MSSVLLPGFPSSLPLARTRSWSQFHYNQVTTLAFSDDGNFLASGDRDGIVYIFNVNKELPVTCLHHDSSVATTVIFWSGSTKLWIGAGDGSITCWRFSQMARQPLQLVDALPVYLPAPARMLTTYEICDSKSQYLIAAYRGTAEVWERVDLINGHHPEDTWKGRGQIASNDLNDRIIACWPLNSTSAIVVFHTQGIRLWNFRNDIQSSITNWPPATTVHSAHLILSRSSAGVGVDGLFGQVIVVSQKVVYHFALALLPVPHVQQLQSFPLMPDMVSLSSCTLWGVSPVLITPCADGLAAIDLTYHRFQLVTGSLQERITQVIHKDAAAGHWRLASFAGKFGRHVASTSRTKRGWIIQLWSATDQCSGANTIQTRSNVTETSLVRVYEQIPRLYLRTQRNGCGIFHWLRKACRVLVFATFIIIAYKYFLRSSLSTLMNLVGL